MTPAEIGVIIFTYDRPAYAQKTLTAALTHLHYSRPLHLHIADDGSPEGQVDHLMAIARSVGPRLAGVTSTDSQRGGYGASYNLATQVIHQFADILLCLEDDWELTRPLDLDPLVAALAERSPEGDGIDCIRLGYVGFTAELRGSIVYVAGQHFLLFDPASTERHVWAGHPRLETVDFQRRVGPWPEGLDAGTTEFVVSGRSEARRGVAWPLDLVRPSGDLFAHIGTRQARSDQREKVEG